MNRLRRPQDLPRRMWLVHRADRGGELWQEGALIFPTPEQAHEHAEPGDLVVEWQAVSQGIAS